MRFFHKPALRLGIYTLLRSYLINTALVVCLPIVPAFAAAPDSSAVHPTVSAPVDSTAADSLRATDPATTNPSPLPRPGDGVSTTLEITDPTQPPAHWVTPSGDSSVVLETFEYPRFLNTYPDEIWEGRAGFPYRKAPKRDVYYRILVEDNNHYLSAKTTGGAINFGREAKLEHRGKEIKANLRVFQKLRWRWRVHHLPEGSDENDKDKNDSAAAVRLVFKGNKWNPLSGKSLKYLWSETLPKGTVIKSRNQYAIVLRSGADDLGKWVWEEVNAYQDYRRLFGGDPRPADYLGLLTDSNNTETIVAADYDDIIFIIPRPTTSHGGDP